LLATTFVVHVLFGHSAPTTSKFTGVIPFLVVTKDVKVPSVHTLGLARVSHIEEYVKDCFALKANAPPTTASTARPVKNIFAFFIKNAAF
jgi:hypothetical protein